MSTNRPERHRSVPARPIRSQPRSRAVHAVLALPLAVLALAAPAHATDWYVDGSYASCGSSDGSAAKPYCTIGAAVAAASAGDTIHVAPNTYFEFVVIDRSLTILGTAGAPTTIVDKNDSTSLFEVRNGASLTLEGLTLRDGRQGCFGDAGSLTLRDCLVQSCSGGRGAAIQVADMDVLLERCTVTNNAATTGSQAIIPGGAIELDGGTLTLLECTFSGNLCGWAPTGRCGQGGAVSASDGALVVIDGCRFDANFSTAGTGAALAFSEKRVNGLGGTPVTATITRSSFSGNQADTDGGAIHARVGTLLTVQDCHFEKNGANRGGAIAIAWGVVAPAPSTPIERCTFVENGVTDHFGNGGTGGALYVGEGSIDLTDCEFTGQFAGEGYRKQGTGGALSIPGGTVTRCTFIGNRAEGSKLFLGGRGGAAHLFGTASFVDCVFEGNMATNRLSREAGSGGGLYVDATGDVTLRRCTVAGNVADTTHGTAKGGGRGGGISVATGGAVSLDHSIVAGNAAEVLGPDLAGSIALVDWNCIGDTADATLVSTGPNDLLDVDPRFADAVALDFSLRDDSPCIDSGDPAAHVAGKDVGAFPRTLDGDLDGALRVDRGGREFSNVSLEVTGSLVPGATLSVISEGTAGLSSLMLVGCCEATLPLSRYGELYVDLAGPFLLLPWPPVPSIVDVDVDPTLPVPQTFFVQQLAYGADVGNLSNLVRLDFE